MNEKEVHLFIDTNCFLHMRDFNQVDWRKHFPGAEKIMLNVCHAVIRELDGHKTSTNSRRRDRARSALRMIEDASAMADMMLPIRPKSPQIDLVIWRGIPAWNDAPALDVGSPDDYLVAAALAESGRGIIFSHDAGPRIRARMAGVRAECPPEEWLLPPEQTDDQQKIAQMRRDLEQARNAKPKLEIVMPVDEPLILGAWSVPYLGISLADSLTQRILSEFPQSQISATPSRRPYAIFDLSAIGQSQVDAYHQQYADFESQMHSYFVTLHEKVAAQALVQMAPGTIRNVGNVSARNLTLTVEVSGGLQLLASRADAEDMLGRIGLPTPPKPPSRIRETASLGISAFTRPDRDPTGFYWSSRPKLVGSTQGCRQCADFRPGREEDLGMLLQCVGRAPHNGKVTIRVSAEHHEELEMERAVIFGDGLGRWLDPDIQAFLPDLVQAAFREIDPKVLPDWSAT